MTIQETTLQFCKQCLGWNDAIAHENFIMRGLERSTHLITHDKNRISELLSDFTASRRR